MKPKYARSSNLNLYINLGLSEIFIINQSESESEDHIDYVYEEIVARSSDGYVSVQVQTKLNHYPGKGSKRSHTSKKISQEDYLNQSSSAEAQFVSGSDVESIQKLADQKQRDATLQREIQGHAPKCQQCGTQMMPKESAHGLFWGCPKFRSCKSRVEPMSADVKAKVRERNGLVLP